MEGSKSHLARQGGLAPGGIPDNLGAPVDIGFPAKGRSQEVARQPPTAACTGWWDLVKALQKPQAVGLGNNALTALLKVRALGC